MILKAAERGDAPQLARYLLAMRDNDHVELHELRGFVAEDRAPLTLPHRSCVRAYTDFASPVEWASTRSRINEATVRPVALASSCRRRSVSSGNLIVIPFTIAR